MLLGLSRSRFAAVHPLKVCLSCMRADQLEFGVAYWHRAHQLPGVVCCPKHLEVLQFAGPGLGMERRDGLRLPSLKDVAIQDRTRIAVPDGDRSPGFALKEVVLAMAMLAPDIHLEPRLLRATYFRALSERGLLRANSKRLRRVELGSAFSEFCRSFSKIDKLSCSSDQRIASYHAARLLSRASMPAHPLSHAILIAWLFRNWTAFWGAYQAEGQRSLPSMPCVPSPSEGTRSTRS